MVSTLDSRSSGLGLRALARDIVLCSLARHVTFIVLSPPRCGMGSGNFNAGGNPAMD